MYVRVKCTGGCSESDVDPSPPENMAICRNNDGGGGNRTRVASRLRKPDRRVRIRALLAVVIRSRMIVTS